MSEDLFEIEARAPGVADAPSGLSTIVLRVHVQPGAGRAAVVGRYGDALHLRVAAPPVGGRANDASEALVGEILGVSKDQVTLAGGDKSRQKRFKVRDVDPEAVRRALDEALAGAGTAGRPGRSRPDRSSRPRR